MPDLAPAPAPAPASDGALFGFIRSLQGSRPWGQLLDAGTGQASLRWVASLDTERWTAVTGSARMAEQLAPLRAQCARPQDRLVLGNWSDSALLAGERFDTVLADYLLGAIEGFAPYWQDRLFERLRPLCHGRFYLVGLEPYVPYRADSAAGRIVGEIGRVRDACLLLSRERPYREYPVDWVLRRMQEAGFRVDEVRRFPIRYGRRFIDSQIDMCLQRLPQWTDRALAQAMAAHLEGLRRRACALSDGEGGLRYGADYVVSAQ